MKKIFVVDTNVLLSDQFSPLHFEEHCVVIPMCVLEELDNIKSRKTDVSRDARAAIRVLEDIIGDSSNVDDENGIVISEQCSLDCHPEARLRVSSMPENSASLLNDTADNTIINTALELQEKHTDYEVVLVSNDINMRLKGKGAGLKFAQAYKRDVVVSDADLLPTGHIKVDEKWLEDNYEDVESKSCGGVIVPESIMPKPMHVGNWVYCGVWAAVITQVERFDGMNYYHMTVKNVADMYNRRCMGIAPKSIHQALAIDSLLDKDKDITIIFGAAGSGKTLLAIAAATEMVKGRKSSGWGMDEIIFSKTMDSQFEEVGFLPGNEHEKLAPWAGAVYDNMEVVARASRNDSLYPRKSIEGDEPFIKLKALNFMRGRSLNRRVLIVDEGQNLSAKQMKTILSRAGENTKVIVMGNLSQIDSDYVSATTSGLAYICQKFDQWKNASIIHIDGVERSRLAEFVETNFE